MPRTLEDELVVMWILFISGLSIVDDIGAWLALFGFFNHAWNKKFTCQGMVQRSSKKCPSCNLASCISHVNYMVYAGKIIDLHVLGLILVSTRVPGVDFKSTGFFWGWISAFWEHPLFPYLNYFIQTYMLDDVRWRIYKTLGISADDFQ